MKFVCLLLYLFLEGGYVDRCVLLIGLNKLVIILLGLLDGLVVILVLGMV